MNESYKASLVYLVLLAPVFIDLGQGMNVLFGYGLLSLSIVFRGGILLIALYFIFSRPKNNSTLYLTLMFFLWLLSSLVWAVHSSYFRLFVELNVFLKITYIFFILIILSSLNIPSKNMIIHIKNSIVLFTLFAALALVFSFVTGYGQDTYGNYAFGTSSFFVSSNGLSIVMLLGLCFTCSMAFENPCFKVFISVLLCLFGILLIGTMTGLVGSLLVVFVYLGLFLTIFNPNLLWKKIIKNTIIICSTFIIVIASYKAYEFFSEYSYYIKKVDKILNEGPRARLVSSAEKHFSNRHIIHSIFGEGMYAYAKNYSVQDSAKNFSEDGYAMTEVDHYDIFGGYGLLFGSSLIFAYIYWLFSSFRNWLRYPNIERFTVSFSIFLVISHAFLAGHVVFNPLVTGILSGVVFLILLHKKTDIIKSVNP